MIVCTIRTVSQTWTDWGMPPRKGETERPPVPQPHAWHAVTPSEPIDQTLKPDAPGGDWHRSTDGVSIVFRRLDDAERFAASLA